MSKYTFNEISCIEEAQVHITDEEYEANDADPAFRYFFSIQISHNSKKLVACSSVEDRD